jgi:hypothetical protein
VSRVIALVAAALAPVIEVNDLMGIGKAVEPRPEQAVIEAGPTVKQ